MWRKNREFICLKSASGVPIWFFPMPYIKTVAMGMLVKAGPRDETPDEMGLAHATEHMVFMATRLFPNNQILSDYIESVGGYFNAFTASEETFYYNQLPAHEAERGFKVLSQMIREPKFTPENISVEMQNIIQEIHRDNDDPSSSICRALKEIMYGNHPLGHSTLGTEESVASFTKDHFERFISRLYVPDNFAFIIVGNIRPKKALNLFNQYFPESLTGNRNQRSIILEAKPTTFQVIMERDVKQAHLAFGTTTTSADNRLALALGLFKVMIDGGSSFPLAQEIRYKRGLCYEIWAANFNYSDLGNFTFYIGTDPKRKDEAFEASMKVVEQAKNSEELLGRAKKLILGQLAFRYEDSEKIIHQAVKEIALRDKPSSYQELIQKIQVVTVKDIEEAVNLYLTPEKMVKVMLIPKA